MVLSILLTLIAALASLLRSKYANVLLLCVRVLLVAVVPWVSIGSGYV